MTTDQPVGGNGPQDPVVDEGELIGVALLEEGLQGGQKGGDGDPAEDEGRRAPPGPHGPPDHVGQPDRRDRSDEREQRQRMHAGDREVDRERRLPPSHRAPRRPQPRADTDRPAGCGRSLGTRRRTGPACRRPRRRAPPAAGAAARRSRIRCRPSANARAAAGPCSAGRARCPAAGCPPRRQTGPRACSRQQDDPAGQPQGIPSPRARQGGGDGSRGPRAVGWWSPAHQWCARR